MWPTAWPAGACAPCAPNSAPSIEGPHADLRPAALHRAAAGDAGPPRRRRRQRGRPPVAQPRGATRRHRPDAPQPPLHALPHEPAHPGNVLQVRWGGGASMRAGQSTGRSAVGAVLVGVDRAGRSPSSCMPQLQLLHLSSMQGSAQQLLRHQPLAVTPQVAGSTRRPAAWGRWRLQSWRAAAAGRRSAARGRAPAAASGGRRPPPGARHVH